MEQHYMEILAEEMRGNFKLVLEAYASLDTKIDEFRRESDEKHELTVFKLQVLGDEVNNLRNKVDAVENNLTAHIDAVAADLSAHRADTEAHPRYLMRE